VTQRFIKKLGEPHAVTIQVELDEEQKVERDRLSRDLRNQLTALAEEKKLAMGAFGQRKKELEKSEAAARAASSTGTELVAVVVQDFLTADNEVVSVRMGSGEGVEEVVAKRTATEEELQEELFGGSEEDKPH